ncbi:uncharacterized protein ARMOST_06153 [Armillaria ostoyae]|uniref:Fungal N-terminal domain-containing protein n=1 Tax=Armillaria ostoyae TaxID=47428 RepID=A0A284R295_ARMOS|nr:uncharacterized protein ARMOST_06153 [Armillaria ostoyae]
MPALNASLQVASLVEASGVPYIEKLAKVTVAVIELLEKKAKNKEDVKELCQSITDTVAVIESLIEMERYLTSIACDLKDVQGKHRGFKGFLNVNKFQDTIQGYKKRVDDLKMDFLIHITGDSMLALIEMHRMLTEMGNAKETASKKGTVIL